MHRYALSHLADSTLLHDLAALVARDRATTAALLAHLAEVDARQLHLSAAYPSMFTYCVGELRMSEDAAFNRIRAARTARRFPAIFDAVADGRLHLTAVGLLAPHLTEDTAAELLAAAAHKTKAEVEQLLAARFPRPDVLAWVEEIPPQQAREPVESDRQLVPERVVEAQPPVPEPALAPHALGRVGDHSRVQPLSPRSFAVQFTMSQSAHAKLRYAQALIGHPVPPGDLAQVVERALDALIPQLEKQKFAATARPNPGRQRAAMNPRHIPAQVKRAVWARDGGQCTFVSATGLRCPARARLEFDHIEPVALGGLASVSGIRLCCRAHNQYEAERTFGPEFMRRKRLAAAEARAAAPSAVRMRVVRAGVSAG